MFEGSNRRLTAVTGRTAGGQELRHLAQRLDLAAHGKAVEGFRFDLPHAHLLQAEAAALGCPRKAAIVTVIDIEISNPDEVLFPADGITKADLAAYYGRDQAVVTPHTWLSRADKLDCPDQLVFDLDPPRSGLDGVRDAARALRDILKSSASSRS